MSFHGEDIITYFPRGEELYKQAQPVDRPQNSPENDKQFVLRLVNGLRDKRMIDHIRCRLDQTLHLPWVNSGQR